MSSLCNQTRCCAESPPKRPHPLYSDAAHKPLTPVEMVSKFPTSAEPCDDGGEGTVQSVTRPADVQQTPGWVNDDTKDLRRDTQDEPLAEGLSTSVGASPYRVSWFLKGRVSPSKRFVYWAFRRLRELPPEWKEYYRRMLRQEVKAARYTSQTWDVFMMVVDGYRKGKWVLAKYGIEADPLLIPKPYNNFWEETTHEERVWAHRRATQMKELQALQRDEDSLVFGAMSMDAREFAFNSLKNLQGGMQGGTPVHSLDLPAPTEEEVEMSRASEDVSSALMSSIEDDKLWNPVLKSRLHKERMKQDASKLDFEGDDEEDDVEVGVGTNDGRGNVPPARFRRDYDKLV